MTYDMIYNNNIFKLILYKEGDNLKYKSRFSYPFLDQLKSIKQMTLAKLVCAHNNAPQIQKNVFRPACLK